MLPPSTLKSLCPHQWLMECVVWEQWLSINTLEIHTHIIKTWDWVTWNLLLHKTHRVPVCLFPLLTLPSKVNVQLVNVRVSEACPQDAASSWEAFLLIAPWKPQRLFGTAAPEGWILVAVGSRALPMCRLIGSRRLPGYLSFVGRNVTRPRAARRSCGRICGRYGVSLGAAGTRCYVWHICQLCITASLASFLYLRPPLQPMFLSRCRSLGRARCLTEASQKASGCLSHRTLLIILTLIFILFVSPTIFLSLCVCSLTHKIHFQ